MFPNETDSEEELEWDKFGCPVRLDLANLADTYGHGEPADQLLSKSMHHCSPGAGVMCEDALPATCLLSKDIGRMPAFTTHQELVRLQHRTCLARLWAPAHTNDYSSGRAGPQKPAMLVPTACSCPWLDLS